MSTTALDTAAIDEAWDGEPSGVRARPPRVAPPLPIAEVARRLVVAEDAARALRAELAERMSPGERIAVGEREVVFVAARVRGDEVVGRSGVRVERRRRW